MKLLISSFLIVFSLIGSAQNLDSSIFVSDFENKVFQQFIKTGETDLVDLFVCMDGSETQALLVHSEVEKLAAQLNGNGVSKKSEKAKIKLIYKSVHSSMLTKYKEEIYFSDIFSNGQYNCVTASALYAVLLDSFQIPYQLKETPNHVYLIADPSNTEILMESTNPSNGVIVYNSKYKKQYVEHLVNNKIISKIEASQSSVDQIFDHFHNEDNDINIWELAGIQYYNKGLVAYHSEDYLEATTNFQKANILYTSNNINFMLNASFSNLLHTEYMEKSYSANSLARYVNEFSTNESSMESAISYYDMVIEEWLIADPNIDKFHQFHNAFLSQVNDTIDVSRFMQVYYPRRGFYSYSINEYAESLKYFNLAYLNDTNNLRLKMAVQEMVGLTVFTDVNHEDMIDTLDYYFDVYPFLIENVQFQRYYSYLYIRTVYNDLEAENFKKAATDMNTLEAILHRYNQTPYYQESIEELYMLMAAHSVFSGDSKKANSYAQRGLALMPDSKVLLEVKNDIKEYNSYSYQSDYVPITAQPTPKEYSDNFNENFPGCWQATKARLDDVEVKISADDNIVFTASKYNKVSITLDGETDSGRWAIRSKSKLLYLIPADDKDNYSMFKIVSISENKLELRMYEGKSCNKEIMVFTRCE